MDMKEMTTFIRSVDVDELEVLWAACKARQKALRSDMVIAGLAAFSVGDTVELTGLSPKYLNGCIGNIVSKKDGKLKIEFTDDFANYRAKGRFGKDAIVPANCVKEATT